MNRRVKFVLHLTLLYNFNFRASAMYDSRADVDYDALYAKRDALEYVVGYAEEGSRKART